MKIQLAGIQTDSVVDGPGIRMTVFLQGCMRCCPECHNPETQDPNGGCESTVYQIMKQIEMTAGIDGITISGGEPFAQAEAAACLAECIVPTGLNIVLYSGYTFEELILLSYSEKEFRRLLETGWLLIDGPYISARRDLNLQYRGSSNQRILDLPRSLKRERAVEWTM